MRVSVVIPTYNERGTIKELIKQIFELHIPELEVMVVDDGSKDGTIDVVRALKKRYPVTLVLRPKKLGLGSALKDGLALAATHSATIAITMDGDLSHDPNIIPAMIERVKGGADCVIGSRRIPGGQIIGWGPVRAFMSRAAMGTARRILRLAAHDVTSGFRAYRRRVLETIDLRQLSSTGYAFQEEMLYRIERAGLKMVEIPIVFRDRRRGKSKLGVKDILEFFWTIFRLKWYARCYNRHRDSTAATRNN